MAWLALHFRCSHESAEALGLYLLAQGAEGVETVDKTEFAEVVEAEAGLDFIADSYLEDLDEQVQVDAYFSAEEAEPPRLKVFVEANPAYELYDTSPKMFITLPELLQRFREELTSEGVFEVLDDIYQGLEWIREADWADQWKQYYEPLEISERLAIVPSWKDFTAREGQVVLQLDPGSAFGTGGHETTSLCLRAVDALLASEAWQKRPAQDRRILDLGTGSGILALAAAKLGEKTITAVDIDPHAAEVARENAEINGLELDIRAAELGQLRENGQALRYDLILANLIADLHLILKDGYIEHLAPGGRILCSGILTEREAEVREALVAAGLHFTDRHEARDWVLLAFRKDL